MTSYTAFLEEAIAVSDDSYQLITLDADVSLGWPEESLGGNVLLNINEVMATAGSLTLSLPNIAQGSPGNSFIFNNLSVSYAFALLDSSGNVLLTLNPGTIFNLYIAQDPTTSLPVWRVIPFGAGIDAIMSLGVKSSDNSIFVTGGLVSPPGGVVDLMLPSSLSNITQITRSGLMVLQEAYPSIWTTVTLTGDGNILIENADGVLGNPQITLNPNITNITSIDIDGITITNGAIIADEANEGLAIVSQGDGVVSINEIEFDTAGSLLVPNVLTAPTITSPYVAQAYCKFVDSGSSPATGGANVITVLNSLNVASVTGSYGVYTITFQTPMSSSDGYCVVASLNRSTATIAPFQVFTTDQTSVNCQITCADSLGNILSATGGVSVVIFDNPLFVSA